MAVELPRHLPLLGVCRWVEAQGRLQPVDLRPQRVEVTVVDAPSVDRFRAYGEAHRPQLRHRPPGLVHRQVHVVQSQQPRRLQALGPFLAEVRDPVVPSPAQVVGVFGLEAVVAMERGGAEHDGHVQPLVVHGHHLRQRIVAVLQGIGIAVRHLVLAVLQQLLPGPQHPAVAQAELDAPVLGARLAHRDALAPPGVHVLLVEVLGVIHVHVAIEHPIPVPGHAAPPFPTADSSGDARPAPAGAPAVGKIVLSHPSSAPGSSTAPATLNRPAPDLQVSRVDGATPRSADTWTGYAPGRWPPPSASRPSPFRIRIREIGR